MAPSKTSNAVKRDARELAATPVPNPYRGQLADPFCDRPVPDDAVLNTASGIQPATRPAPSTLPPRLVGRIPAPRPAVIAGVTGIVIGSVIGLFGLMLFAILGYQSELGAPDRSFHQGSDSNYLVLALLDFVIAAVCIGGASALLSGRVAGRVALTMGGWMVVGLSFFWWHADHVRGIVPVIVAVAAALMLVALYDRRVTRWLGVLPAAQPD